MGDEQRLGYVELLDTAREGFESGTDFTIAVEEEFALLDPATLGLVNRFEEVQEAAQGTALEPNLVGELIASEVEIKTGRRESFAEIPAAMTERRAQLDDRGRRVPDRREAVSDLVVGVPCMHASCVGENGLEHGANLVRAPLEEVRVQALEARLWSAIRLALRLRRVGERG